MANQSSKYLIVEDDYYSKVSTWVIDETEVMKTTINDYGRIMTNVAENGIIEGVTATALKEFVDQVKNQFTKKNSNPFNWGAQLKVYCNSYISFIDDADGDLY